jgi:hypothetical protein
MEELSSLCFDGSIFGYVKKEWYFSQSKYPFLVDYLTEFLDKVLGIRKGSFTTFHKENAVRSTGLLSCGRQVLISLGIAKWSWKVERWIEKVERLEKEHIDLMASFLTTHDVAKRLHVDPERL